MVKKSATILVMLLTLTLGAAYADGDHGHHYGNDKGSDVPEPGSLLVFGSGLLMTIKALKRKA